jgi:fluoride exporter
MTELIAVALGGALGAMMRAGLAALAAHRPAGDWPWGTVVANLIGSFLLGVVVGRVDGTLALLLGAGVMGGLTTFSTSMAESVRLSGLDGRSTAWGYTAVTLGGSLAAAGAGLALGG